MSERSQDATDITGARFGDHRLPKRFWEKVEPEPNSGCWLWIAALNGVRGCRYGWFGWRGKTRYAHRVAFEELVRKVGSGRELDHRCRVTECVNPHHLAEVSHRENVLAIGSRNIMRPKYEADVCLNGHSRTPENTVYSAKGRRPRRNCRVCRRVGYMRRRRRIGKA